ncbi:hypothetical protein DIPPA_34814 [Diplonema papillatum]|nr:hypothetical protein DIPPA_34814 [Diplonema papillatum]
MIVWRCRRNALQRLRCGGAAVLRSGGARARAATPTQKRWETGKQAYQVGDLVEVRDGSEAWRLGVVTGYKKGEVMVMVDGWRNACSWDQVQAIPYQPAPDWLEEGDRILCDGQKHPQAAP